MYRTPAPRIPMTLPRRGFIDSAQRCCRAWNHATRWPNSSAPLATLLCCAMPAIALGLLFGDLGWFFGVMLGWGMLDTDLDSVVLGFLRAKRVQWIMRRQFAGVERAK